MCESARTASAGQDASFKPVQAEVTAHLLTGDSGSKFSFQRGNVINSSMKMCLLSPCVSAGSIKNSLLTEN